MRHLLIILAALPLVAQAQPFTLADSLRGALSPWRSCFDVTYYDLQIRVDPEKRTVAGSNRIHFQVVEDLDSLQLDLFPNMIIDSIVNDSGPLGFSRIHGAVFVSYPNRKKAGDQDVLTVYYHGAPVEAKNPPWDGGFVWQKTVDGKPWVAVACEGTGASLWWPNKDHLSDEPDSMRIRCTVPNEVMCVANGNLEHTDRDSTMTEWVWKVSYPINNYNVTLNIADYAHFGDVHLNRSTGDTLQLDYYVLPQNLTRAKEQFRQVHGMLDCFEEAFGPYPFYRDGYALVETPYLGMEHQSAIAYGNRYMPGYLGRFPGNMDFDYIIIHESGHEWWGNSVSMRDAADMWIHESFCTYSEAVYVECVYGYDSMLEYLLYQRNFINNRSPIQGVHGVNRPGNSGDMYYKGSWMIHTLRNVLNNDSLFRAILKGIAQEFAHTTVDGEDIVEYVNDRAGIDLNPFFDQYLNFAAIPVLEYRWSSGHLQFRWRAEAEEFQMPVIYSLPEQPQQRVMVFNDRWVSVPMGRKQFKQLRLRDDLLLFSSERVK